MYEFDCPEPITLALRIAGGDAEIIAEERRDATVEVGPADNSEASRDAAARTRVELHDGTLHIEAPEWTGWLFRRGPRVRMSVRLPHDCALAVKVASADIRATGRYRSASVTSASGDADIEYVTGDASVHAASGDFRVGRVDGNLKINTASGDITVGYVGGDSIAHSASGDIAVDHAGGSLRATTASGDIAVRTATTGTVRANSASGDVSIGVAAGTGVWLDLSSISGDTRTDLTMPAGYADQSAATLTLQVRTVSGDIDVHRATVPAAA
ncbi:DUF4097 domain-containing protein [Planosporangium flavigriseum]|uniref:DUF4097 domain-containing protein n=1 Tax=Planosporangium flavigriseum TaxID=373681 RepID=A0A8J3PL87_9ACTN|nr:DUF4097 family beta strand repeat-containing protein [Planosporangium flavigriseum]NJC64053.1 DUF4097 domain-containing protein [Planosporangium flavigriseum]GIG72934.1 hypothetical protein Pfl04_13380 [Planosporangium flavigriseum]